MGNKQQQIIKHAVTLTLMDTLPVINIFISALSDKRDSKGKLTLGHHDIVYNILTSPTLQSQSYVW